MKFSQLHLHINNKSFFSFSKTVNLSRNPFYRYLNREIAHLDVIGIKRRRLYYKWWIMTTLFTTNSWRKKRFWNVSNFYWCRPYQSFAYQRGDERALFRHDTENHLKKHHCITLQVNELQRQYHVGVTKNGCLKQLHSCILTDPYVMRYMYWYSKLFHFIFCCCSGCLSRLLPHVWKGLSQWRS